MTNHQIGWKRLSNQHEEAMTREAQLLIKAGEVKTVLFEEMSDQQLIDEHLEIIRELGKRELL